MKREQVSQAIAQLMPNIIQGIHLDFVSERNVTHTQFLMLVAIHARVSCPMNVLATNMHISMPTATGIVDRLVKSGFVKRVSLEKDRRKVVIQLTAKGLSLIRAFQATVSKRWQEVLRFLNEEELKAFFKVINRLQTSFKQAKV